MKNDRKVFWSKIIFFALILTFYMLAIALIIALAIVKHDNSYYDCLIPVAVFAFVSIIFNFAVKDKKK